MSSDDGVAPGAPGAGALAVERLRRWGGEQLVRDLRAIFLADTPARLAASRAGLRAGDSAAVARLMHAMKSSCAQFGAVAMARLCEDAEVRAERNALGEVPALVDQLEAEFADFRLWLVWVTGTEEERMRTIAVVEDNADNRLLVQAILGELYHVREYETGAKALEGFGECLPEAVLLDISLPVMDGVEVLSRIRADDRLRALPVIALTAHAMTGDREMYLAAGFDEYVAKPIVDEDALLRAVARCLGDVV